MPVKDHKQFKPLSLVDQVSQQIQEDILTHQLAIGDRLPTEPKLMVHFNVGRSTVREAIKVLVNLGLIEVKQGKGTTIINDTLPDQTISSTLKNAPVIEAYEARKALEVGIVDLACHNRNATDLKAMNYYLEIRSAAAKLHSLDAYRHADEQFHEAITEATHNSVITDIYTDFWNSFKDRFGAGFTKTELYHEQSIIHQNILEAIKQQDPHQAVYWIEKNITLLEQTVND
ncbi:HTH-type transcriptional repressor NanR [Lentilactobacillus hilgardii]|uniref:FadR/GntR family transcriptional regulator n=1 Tax=Lentilactobacillus hilgardii TaxID=1588 RepID=UPI00019C5428|nr:FadR/GntR family transcriptional regulator [Lentilactobacillus hilgardii]EEI21087.1 transcriptional regulator, GntR family [Lentilactobacillus buchneri ATCC 11577]MCT3396170.1 FadR family transcriptional regulator [Lentilactobacillus hilgardii]QIR10660.1 HTH-type transcriptional repressor NanR [Lentilactobacillus hilgardii]